MGHSAKSKDLGGLGLEVGASQKENIGWASTLDTLPILWQAWQYIFIKAL
jgi:hypothetical protein